MPLLIKKCDFNIDQEDAVGFDKLQRALTSTMFTSLATNLAAVSTLDQLLKALLDKVKAYISSGFLNSMPIKCSFYGYTGSEVNTERFYIYAILFTVKSYCNTHPRPIDKILDFLAKLSLDVKDIVSLASKHDAYVHLQNIVELVSGKMQELAANNILRQKYANCITNNSTNSQELQSQLTLKVQQNNELQQEKNELQQIIIGLEENLKLAEKRLEEVPLLRGQVATVTKDLSAMQAIVARLDAAFPPAQDANSGQQASDFQQRM